MELGGVRPVGADQLGLLRVGPVSRMSARVGRRQVAPPRLVGGRHLGPPWSSCTVLRPGRRPGALRRLAAGQADGNVGSRRAGWRARRRRARARSTAAAGSSGWHVGHHVDDPPPRAVALVPAVERRRRTAGTAGPAGRRSSGRRRAAAGRSCSAGHGRRWCGSPPCRAPSSSASPSTVPTGWFGDTPTTNGSSTA